MVGLPRFRSLVRGVSNSASRVYPTCAHMMPISGLPEIGGRRILRDGRYAMIASLESACACALLRMRRITVCTLSSRFISTGNRFSPQNYFQSAHKP